MLNRAIDWSVSRDLRKTGKRVDDVSFGLFIAAGIIGLIQLHFPVEFGAGYEMVAIARNLAAHGGCSQTPSKRLIRDRQPSILRCILYSWGS